MALFYYSGRAKVVKTPIYSVNWHVFPFHVIFLLLRVSIRRWVLKARGGWRGRRGIEEEEGYAGGGTEDGLGGHREPDRGLHL